MKSAAEPPAAVRTGACAPPPLFALLRWRCCGGKQPAGRWAAPEPDQRAAAARLLKYLGERGALELAVRVFDWLDARPAYPTRDAYHYDALMSAFSRRGAANDAARVRTCAPCF